MRILLVEDEAPLRETLSARLKREGFAVDSAQDGEEGLYMGRGLLPVRLRPSPRRRAHARQHGGQRQADQAEGQRHDGITPVAPGRWSGPVGEAWAVVVACILGSGR